MNRSDEPRPTPQPEPRRDADAMTPDQLAEAKRYGRLGLVCGLADRALDVAYLGAMALLLAPSIDRWLQGSAFLAEWWTPRLAVFLVIVFSAHVAVSFPLSCYSGHTLEHQFGLSNQSFRAWLWRYAKQLAISLALELAMFIGLFWLIWTTGRWWWPSAAAASFVVMVLLNQLAPVLLLPLFYKTERLDQPELLDRLKRLADGTGLSIEGVYRLDLSEETRKGNAMLAGLGRTRRVLLGDTLLAECNLDELEVIFAHEIGHHVFRHIWKLIAVGLVYVAVGFWLCDASMRLFATEMGSPINYAHMPVYTAAMVLFVFAVFKNLAEPIQNAISRRFERQCDRYALMRTGLRQAFISAFRKLSKLNKDDPDPHWLEVLLLHSHPTIGQRIAMAESFDGP